MKLLGLQIDNYYNDIKNKFIPFGKMYTTPNEYKFIHTKYELPIEIQNVYSNTSDINVSGVISNNSNIFDIIYNIILNFSFNIYQDDNIKAKLWYTIGEHQYMLIANNGDSIVLYETFPNNAPQYLGTHFNNETIYPKITGYTDYWSDTTPNTIYDNILLITNRTEIRDNIPGQQTYIESLTNIFNTYNKHVQIVTLTNSPFVLTDLFVDNCIYLDENFTDQKIKNETFAANLFDILCYNLNMNASFGSIAHKFLSSLIQKKQSGENVNSEIYNYIGDNMYKKSIKHIKP